MFLDERCKQNQNTHILQVRMTVHH